MYKAVRWELRLHARRQRVHGSGLGMVGAERVDSLHGTQRSEVPLQNFGQYAFKPLKLSLVISIFYLLLKLIHIDLL